MIQQVTWFDFSGWFFKSDTYKNNFSYDGLRALFGYFEQYEEDTGEQTEFDPIAICCEYSEYTSLDDIKKEYDDIETLEDLEDKTDVIQLDNGGLIIRRF